MAERLPIGVRHAIPFWIALLLVPVAWGAAIWGGWVILLLALVTWWLFPILDFALGNEVRDADPETPDGALFWYRAVTHVWVPAQTIMVFGILAYITWTDHLTTMEEVFLFLSLGILTGAIGIVFAHELMHQPGRYERYLGDILMSMVLYGHFRSEHLLVHHQYVGTPRDAVTARYNEGFHRYFLRVIPECWISAFRSEREKLARKGLPWWDRSNPFWRYWALQAGFLLAVLMIGGWYGLLLFCLQAVVAIWQLEIINYIEHYGLVRKHLGNGRYEPQRPCHSWNASHRATNWLLINLQRHSDHHVKPARRFPLLQNRASDEAPQLPFGYGLMGMIALVPPLWRKIMNPRVKRWRASFYPEIADWSDYKTMSTPMPR